MLNIEKPRTAVRDQGLSAWLLCNVFHRDEVADLVLEVSPPATNTRPWYCLLFPDRPPVKIVHGIERSILDHVPGETIVYTTRDALTSALSKALPSGGNVAADFSRDIPVGSFLDHGTALLVEGMGCSLVPAEALVARCLGTIDEEGRRSHDAAAAVLYAAVADAWALVRERLGSSPRSASGSLFEGEIRDLIQTRIAAAGLASDSPPIVGAGVHSSDPHYSPKGNGAPVLAGEVIQLDMWAREDSPNAVYADISWVGVAAARPTPEHEKVFDAVMSAREAAVELLTRQLEAGDSVRGADVDAAARAVLSSRGYASFIRHRTGHSIGNRVHGFGVNLDAAEFPDARAIPEGACFSIEPGLYLPDFGMRTEIDCCIRNGRLEVTGGKRQDALLTLGQPR